MQESGSLFEVFRQYFEQDIIVMVIIAALPWLIKEFSKKQKIFLSGIIVGLLLLFNVITFWLMSRLGEAETYYRLFWILPCACIFAILIIKLWEQLKNNRQKVTFALVLGIAAFVHSNINLSDWIPRNLYYLPEETMLLADLIEEDSDNRERAYVYDYSDAIYGIREYDANIILVDDGVEGTFDSMFANNEGNVLGCIVCATAMNNHIEYVYIEKEKEDAQMSLLAGGASYAGETNEHRVYRFDLEEMETVYNLAISGKNDITVFDIEYAHIAEEDILDRFIYYADGRLEMVDENIEWMNVSLSGEKEYEVLEFDKYYICSINNSEGKVSADAVEQFETLNQQGKPIVLFLASPLQDGQMNLNEPTDENMLRLQRNVLMEDSMVSAVYVRGYAEVWRSRLENGIVQCGCTVYESTAITVKGSKR